MISENKIYKLLREFYYEKNGLDLSIDFLKGMLEELENIKKELGGNE